MGVSLFETVVLFGLFVDIDFANQIELVLIGGVVAVIFGVVVYCYTQKRSVEKQNKELRTQLQNANERMAAQDRFISLGILTAGIVHEIKNPLNVIKSFTELSLDLMDEFKISLLGDKESLDCADVKDFVDSLQTNLTRIGDQTKRANNTIQHMLAHSRGGQKPEKTNIHQLLDEYLNLSYYGIRADKPSFNVKITKRYDFLAPDVEVVAEEVGRVFLNLFNNAYYTLLEKVKKDPSFSPEIIITTSLRKEVFEIRVKDNGLGIPENQKDKIFMPFFTTKPHGVGTGIGLSLSRAIICDLGGCVDFASKEGVFTEFRITLPVK